MWRSGRSQFLNLYNFCKFSSRISLLSCISRIPARKIANFRVPPTITSPNLAPFSLPNRNLVPRTFSLAKIDQIEHSRQVDHAFKYLDSFFNLHVPSSIFIFLCETSTSFSSSAWFIGGQGGGHECTKCTCLESKPEFSNLHRKRKL